MRLAILATLPLLVLVSCGDDSPSGADTQTLNVLAAASLTGSFDELAAMFEAEHEGVDVEGVYDSSSTLATQVSEGAPADVLATADLDTMQRVLDAGDADSSDTFAGNTAVLVTPAGNPAGITSFADLDKKGVTYVVCVDTAPCGKIGAALLESNEIKAEPASFEDNVKAVLEKVTAGEVDAGIVYVTDGKAAGADVIVVEIPGAADQVTGYAVAVVKQSEDAALAQAFVDLVLSAEGQAVLRDAGFVEAP
ncbi:MAG TPA: molybdate ABC transporter substrate-binding protein [Nocardioidaceae bacterium]|nr:molybdate ABC transporter substrate-binding protein [Nocardioidaceae bacterium]